MKNRDQITSEIAFSPDAATVATGLIDLGQAGLAWHAIDFLLSREVSMAEAHYYANLVWSGGALGPTKSVESYSREFRAEFEGKSPFRGSADPAFHGDAALYNPEDLLLSALSACHMLSYLAVCAHAGILVLSYEDAAVGTLARRDGKVRFVDVLLRPKVVLKAGSDIEKARALHEKAHDICVIVNSVNFPVRHEAKVAFASEGAAAA